MQQPKIVPEDKFTEGDRFLPCRYNYLFTIVYPTFPGFISPKVQHVAGTDYQISAEMVQALIRKYINEIRSVMDRGNLEVIVDIPLINKSIPAQVLPEGKEDTFTYYSMSREKLNEAQKRAKERLSQEKKDE